MTTYSETNERNICETQIINLRNIPEDILKTLDCSLKLIIQI